MSDNQLCIRAIQVFAQSHFGGRGLDLSPEFSGDRRTRNTWRLDGQVQAVDMGLPVCRKDGEVDGSSLNINLHKSESLLNLRNFE